MNQSDQTLKIRIILLAAAFSLLGFVLEIGPVGGVFSLSNSGPTVAAAFTLELMAGGFLAYLALAASAAVGLHPSEEEPTPKKEQPAGEKPQAVSTSEQPQENVRERVRPELHQLRMLFTAMGGYVVIKGISLALMTIFAHPNLTSGQYIRLFQFGFVFIALSWFVLWQFLRWFAQEKRWIRLQDELVGADVTRIIAVVILFRPFIFLVTALTRGTLLFTAMGMTTLLIHLSLVAIAIILWFARPTTLRRTLVALGTTGGIVVLLTIVLAIIERGITGT